MKVKVIKDSVIYAGNIYKVGEAFECDVKVAESLIERGYVAVDVPQGEEFDPNPSEDDVYPVPYSRENLGEKEYKEVQQIAKELGLNASGKKEEIIERILEFLAVDEESEEADEETANDEETGSDELPNTDMPE